jgi:hypothetical protein
MNIFLQNHYKKDIFEEILLENEKIESELINEGILSSAAAMTKAHSWISNVLKLSRLKVSMKNQLEVIYLLLKIIQTGFNILILLVNYVGIPIFKLMRIILKLILKLLGKKEDLNIEEANRDPEASRLKHGILDTIALFQKLVLDKLKGSKDPNEQKEYKEILENSKKIREAFLKDEIAKL